MRMSFGDVFEVEVVQDEVRLTAIRPVAVNPYWELLLQSEIKRSSDPVRLRQRALEVYEDEEGRLHVDGFAAAEAR